MHMQSICIKRAILRVNCYPLFPTEEMLTIDSKNVQTSVAVAPPVQYKDVLVLPVPLPSAQGAGSWFSWRVAQCAMGEPEGSKAALGVAVFLRLLPNPRSWVTGTRVSRTFVN